MKKNVNLHDISLQNLKGGDHLGDPVVDGRIILKWP
jgi:hypothetical protein